MSYFVVQFCDFVSVPRLAGLAGRVVSILLDYVGPVSLCSKLTKLVERHEEWPRIHRTTCESAGRGQGRGGCNGEAKSPSNGTF